MNLKLLRRKYRILLLIVIAGTVYLCFQLFSLKVLNFSNQKEIHHKQNAKIFNDFDIDKDVNLNPVTHVAQSDTNQKDTKLKYEGKETDLNKQGTPKEKDIGGVKIVLGIPVSLSEQYRPTADGKFQCLESKEYIPFSSVNDDYCDCEDSSDEPGTSACPNSRFYCTFQNPDISPQFLPGSRVNDGVCDCCDGSDEWAGISVFSGVHIVGKTFKGTLTHTPCKNDCKAILDMSREDARIREMGRRLKLSYLEKGKAISNPKIYGPDSVFYKLSFSCFEFDTPEYNYKLCPFQSVTQKKFSSSSINIGKHPVWRSRIPGHYELKMDKGSPERCPLGSPRNTVILFICGLTDKIITVSEDERCTYAMKFSTPAAC